NKRCYKSPFSKNVLIAILTVALVCTTAAMAVFVVLWNKTATTTTALPSQCSSYLAINDATTVYSYYCSGCYTDCAKSVAWYRVVGSSGTQLYDRAPNQGYCGTNYAAYYMGTSPTYYGQTVTGTVCTFYSTNVCYWSTTISVTNCGTYYVYYLPQAPGCNNYVRYCTM
ncbi:unnamed protein product, partial [Didymodactylos carnosus]